MYHSSLKAFTCLEVCPLDHDGLVLLSVVAQALLITFCVYVLVLFFPMMLMTAVSGSPSF
jgi:hypothetical protein